MPVLADADDVRYQGFSGIEIVRAARWMPEVAEAFRSGGAPAPLPWAPEGRPEFNRAVFLNLLARQWLPAIADVDLRLRGEPAAQVADLACGTGWSSIAMAQAYPLISVDGFDLDPDAIQAARRNAQQAGVADRVRFAVADASGPGVPGQYDLVTIFEALHDIPRPVDALRAARLMLTKAGCVLIADELVQDAFTAPAAAEEITMPGAWWHACRPSWATRRPPRPEPCCDLPHCADTPCKPASGTWKSSRSRRTCCASTG